MHTQTHTHTQYTTLLFATPAKLHQINDSIVSRPIWARERESRRAAGRSAYFTSGEEKIARTMKRPTIMQVTVCAQHVPISLLLVAFRSCWNENSQLIPPTAITIAAAATTIRSIGKFCFVISDNEHNEHLRDTTQLPSKLIYVCRVYNKPTEQISLRKMHPNNRLLRIALLRTYRRISSDWNAWENSMLMR